MTLRQKTKPIKLLAASLGMLAISTTFSQAACLVNVAGKSLLVFMKSPVERIERSFPIGAQVCQSVAKDVVVEVNILPYVVARFGCKTSIRGKDVVRLKSFSTMNKCEFD